MPIARRHTSATAPAAALWTGWRRPRGGVWQPLVSTATYDAAWGALLGEAGNGRGGGDLIVLPAGKQP